MKDHKTILSWIFQLRTNHLNQTTFLTRPRKSCSCFYFLCDGISQPSVTRLQPVQNAVQLLSGTTNRYHIAPVSASLHWLPVKFRIQYKILLFVGKALNGLAPSSIANVLCMHTASRPLRSIFKSKLKIYIFIPKPLKMVESILYEMCTCLQMSKAVDRSNWWKRIVI